MTGRERVESPENQRENHREQTDPEAELVASDQIGEGDSQPVDPAALLLAGRRIGAGERIRRGRASR